VTTHKDPDDWAKAFLADVEKTARGRLLDAVQDSGLSFVGGVPKHGEVEGRMAGVVWSTRRLTGQARDSLTAQAGEVSSFPVPIKPTYPAEAAMIAKLSAAIDSARVPVITIGSSVGHYPYIEGRYKSFSRAVETLLARLRASRK